MKENGVGIGQTKILVTILPQLSEQAADQPKPCLMLVVGQITVQLALTLCVRDGISSRAAL